MTPIKIVHNSFTPLNLSNLAIWFDAADSASMSLSGSNINTWNDKSTNAFAAVATTAPTLGSSVLNSKSCVQFTGTQSLTFGTTAATSNAFTLYFVARATNTALNYLFQINNSTNPYLTVDLWGGNNTADFGNNNHYHEVDCASNTWYACCFVYNGSGAATDGNYTLYRNGTTNPTVVSQGFWGNNFNLNIIGGVHTATDTTKSNCDIADIILVDGVSSAGDISSMRTYFTNKWAITF